MPKDLNSSDMCFKPRKLHCRDSRVAIMRIRLPIIWWKKCNRCGSQNHLSASKTLSETSKFFKCGYVGHCAMQCRSRSEATDSSAPSDGASALTSCTLKCLHLTEIEHFLKVNGVIANALIDTGSSQSSVNKILQKVTMTNSSLILHIMRWKHVL